MRRQIGKNTSREAGVGFVCLAFLIATAPYLSGQEHFVEAGKAPTSAQHVERDYRFEVASIHPTDPYGPNRAGTLHPYSPGRYRQERIYLGGLAFEAFGLKDGDQIEYPKWMASTFFSINATLPEGATKADLPIMIRHLLEDRFALIYHHETRQLAGYELVVAKVRTAPDKIDGATPGSSDSQGTDV